jgi:PAS domain S-box-containing protein
VLAAVDAVAGAVSGHQGIVWAILPPLAGLAFVSAGLLGWVLRPENGSGRLLVLVGTVFMVLAALWAANESLLYTLGSALASVYLAIFVHLLLSYPTGRLRRPLERHLVGLLYVVAAAASLLPSFFDRDLACSKCPSNEFLIHDSQRTADVLNGMFSAIGIAVFAGLFVVLALRWRRASHARRRVLTPVYASGGAAVALLGLGFAAGFASSTAGSVFWALSLVSFLTLPFFFVGGLVRGRFARAALHLLRDSPDEPTPSEAEASLRRALNDPTLRLAYWLEETGGYVDPLGEPFQLHREREGRLTSKIEYEGRPLAAIEYDASLRHEPELLEEVLATARLALEKDRGLQALRRSEARSRALLGVLPDVMIRTDREGTYLEVQGNRSGLVRPAEELIGLTIRDTLPPDLVEEILACIARTLDCGCLQTLEYELEVGGERRDFEARMIPSGDDEVVSVVRDFTAERRLQDEVAARLGEVERERQFASAVGNTAPVVILLVDAEGRIVRLNATGERLLGYPRDETIHGRPFWDVFVDLDDHARARDVVAALVAGAPTVERELRARTRTGDELVLATCSAPILEGDGNHRFLICGLDVTERERHLAELRASRARIVEAGDAARRRLERNLHDGAQQRLVSLSLALRLALGRLASEPEGAREILSAASAELAFALEELRELARGLHPAVLTDRGLHAALESLAARVPVPVELEADFEQRLPVGVEAALFYVASEALTNVAKYAHASVARVRVTRSDGFAVVEVSDDGVGGADPTRGSGLRGLGDRLAALDGVLEIESPPGRGTRVRAVVPVAAPPPEQGQSPPWRGQSPTELGVAS